MCDKCKESAKRRYIHCIHCGKLLLRQELLWIPLGKPVEGHDSILRVEPIPYTGKKPDRLWTLYEELYSNKKPELPYKPEHLKNAFLEDYVYDWDINNGFLHYYSRVTNGGNWALLEF